MKATYFNNLGTSLSCPFGHLDHLADLDEDIIAFKRPSTLHLRVTLISLGISLTLEVPCVVGSSVPVLSPILMQLSLPSP